MKKIAKIISAIAMLCVLLLEGCGLGVHSEPDYAAAIMVEGNIYLKSGSAMPAEIDESAIIGYTTSYTDSFPKKDGETNFNRELNMPYARVEGGIAILYENEWYLCTPMEQNAVAPDKCLDEVAGNITFYEEPVKEAHYDAGTVTVRLYRDLNEEQAEKLKDIIDDVDDWTDDHSVDRLAYYFDGDFQLSDREHKYYFTYEYNVIYYDHYYAEIPAEDMQYIMDLGAECAELPDKTAQDQVSVDSDFGFAFKLVEGTFARGERICLSVVLTNQQNESYVWTGPQSHFRARVKFVNTNGTDEYTISPEPIPDTDDMGDYQVPSNEARSFEYYFCIPYDAVPGVYSLICSFDTSSQTFNDVFNLDIENDELPDVEPTEYTQFFNIEEPIELCKGIADEQSRVTVKFKSTEGPSAFFVEVWHRAGENDEWAKSEAKSALVGDAPAFTVPGASEYVVVVTATEGNNGNVTFLVTCS